MKLSNCAKIFKALSNEQRLKIFMTIYNWEKTNKCCVDKGFTKVSEIMDISRSTISHHFKELENAGLLLCSKKGQSCSCRVNKEILKEIKEFLK